MQVEYVLIPVRYQNPAMLQGMCAIGSFSSKEEAEKYKSQLVGDYEAVVIIKP